MNSFSCESFQWSRLVHAIHQSIDHFVHPMEQERVLAEAMKAHFTLRQAKTPSGVRQHGELVCPRLAELEQTITLDFPDFVAYLVHAPGAADLNADEVLFEDTFSMMERYRRSAAAGASDPG